MLPLKNFLTEENLGDLASRSNFRYGKAMAKDSDVAVLKTNTFNLVAKIKHGQGETRTVELMSTTKGFRFRCTCTAKKNFFCKHCVAVGLSAI